MNTKKRLQWSALIALGTLVLYYFIGNLPFLVKGEKKLLSGVEFVKNIIGLKRPSEEDEKVLFINVDYDKELRTVFDEKGREMGQRPYTDRQKLLRLLQFLNKNCKYEYIMLDVLFTDEVKTEWDSALFAQIASMPLIVIPSDNENEKLADESLRAKAGEVSYYESKWVKGFSIYPYYCKKEKSMPLKMYEEIAKTELKKFGPFYFDGGSLSKKCEFLTLDITAASTFYDDGNQCWYNLGSEVIDGGTESSFEKLVDFPEMFNGKYIVIGSFQPNGQGDDMVSTFKGTLSGAVINYNAFLSLKEQKHKVSFFAAFCLYLLFFVVSWIMLGGGREKEKIQKWADKRGRNCSIICFLVLPWLKSTVILQAVIIVIYLLFGKALPLLLLSIVFYYLSLFIKLKNQIQQWPQKQTKES